MGRFLVSLIRLGVGSALRAFGGSPSWKSKLATRFLLCSRRRIGGRALGFRGVGTVRFGFGFVESGFRAFDVGYRSDLKLDLSRVSWDLLRAPPPAAPAARAVRIAPCLQACRGHVLRSCLCHGVAHGALASDRAAASCAAGGGGSYDRGRPR